MGDDIVSNKNLSSELIKEIFEGAYFDASVDPESGDVIIQERYKYYVELDNNSQRFITFRINITRNQNAGIEDRHQYINDVNNGLIAIRVAEFKEIFSFDHYLWVEGGVTRKNIVMAFKTFTSLVESALSRAPESVFN